METIQTHNEPSLASLVDELEAAKAAEEKAKAQRIFAEQQIIPFLNSKEVGSASTKIGDGRVVTVKQGFNWSFDREKYRAVRDTIPENLRPVQIKEICSPTIMTFMQRNEPELFKSVCDVFTQRPAKPSVTIRRAKT
jgi:hypothetical protein